MTKIIQVLHHSLTPFKLGVDPRFYEGDWHVRVAKELAKRTSHFEIECWRPERTFKNVYTRKDELGITHKIFPSTFWTYALEYSLPLLKSLQSELKQNDQVIAHLHGLYNLHADIISLSTRRKCPTIAQSHGGSPWLIEIKKKPRANLFHPFKLSLLLAEEIAFRNVDRFFVLSMEEEAHFSRRFGKERVRIQPMGVDLEKFKPVDKNDAREKLGLDKNKSYALYVGRLHESKGVQYLIEALKKLHAQKPELTLVLVGDGPHKDMFKEMSRTMGLERNVVFTGWVKPDELLLYYNASDVFVYPSLHEPWGIAILEALACRRPVIATFTGCVPKLVADLENGVFVIPKKDAMSLANTISRVLPEANEISRKISREKLQKYGWNSVIENTLTTYRELLQAFYD